VRLHMIPLVTGAHRAPRSELGRQFREEQSMRTQESSWTGSISA
jgi:hypothetical protein